MQALGDTAHRLIEPIAGGAYARVYEGLWNERAAIIKVAREIPLDLEVATGPVFASAGVRLQTGSIGAWVPTPNEIVEGEARVLSRVRHRGLAALLERGEVEHEGTRRAYLVTERIDGRTWRQRLLGGDAPAPDELLDLAQLLVALQESGLSFHGDLKPDNVLTETSGEVLLIDPSSGLAALDAWGHPLRLFTTPEYYPTFAASDVSAFGMLALECLSAGCHPLDVETRATSREIGPALQLWLRVMSATGRSRMVQRYPWIRLPSDHRLVDPNLEALALRCLGLDLTDAGALERVEPFATMAEVRDTLSARLASERPT